METPNRESCSLEPSKIEEHRNSGRRGRTCDRCGLKFEIDERYFVIGSTSWHIDCFQCAQCFAPLIGGIYFEFEGRIYCQHDFNTLYAPICAKCDNFVTGRVIRTVNCSFHVDCFTCENCGIRLQNSRTYRSTNGQILCYSCNQLIPKRKIYNCMKCRQNVEEADLLIYRHDAYHAYHFKCSDCSIVLDNRARTLKDLLYCPRCFDLRCEVCFECKTVIDPQVERSIYCMGKHWHLEHFRCATCSRPFNGHAHYERNDKAYCRKDFLELIGNQCFVCNKTVGGSMIHVFGKKYCPECYRCRGCDRILAHKDKVMEYDMLPLCKKCIGQKNFQKILKLKANGE